MNKNLKTRTTITVPTDILFALKKKALEKRKGLSETISEGLKIYLRLDLEMPKKDERELISLFGAWNKGVSGVQTIKKLRLSKKDLSRNQYLAKKWKKS